MNKSEHNMNTRKASANIASNTNALNSSNTSKL